MANPWFRLHADILNNSKVQIVTEALRWRYVALLCLQCNGTYEKRPDDEIALSLRITVDEWIETKKVFIERKLLNSDGGIYGWEKRQYISDIKDPTAAERQKRYREKNRNARNDTVTSRLPESDTDTDKYNAKKDLISKGVSNELLSDFIVLRKSHRAPITKTVVDKLVIESNKAGITVSDAIKTCCEKSWRGFEAEWYLKLKPASAKKPWERT